MFLKSPIVTKYLGQNDMEILSQKTFKNRPICSHWLQYSASEALEAETFKVKILMNSLVIYTLNMLCVNEVGRQSFTCQHLIKNISP